MSQVSSGESLYHHLHCLWVPITTARRFHLPLGQLGCHTPHRIALVLHLTDNRLKPLRTVQGLAAVFWCEDFRTRAAKPHASLLRCLESFVRTEVARASCSATAA